MLRPIPRSLAVIVAAVGLLVFVGPSVRADAGGPGPIQVRGDNKGGNVDTTVTVPGSNPSAFAGSASSGRLAAAGVSSGLSVTCTYAAPRADGHLFREFRGSDPGQYFFVSCTDGSRQLVWFPDAAPPRNGDALAARAAVLSPAVLARQAFGRLPLPAPRVHHSPDATGGGRPQTVVGVQTWLWVDPVTFGALTQTVSVGPVWATVTARPVSTVWATGSPDAAPATCPGPGVAYDPRRVPSVQSTYCSTVYLRSSAGQPQTGPSDNDRFFTGSATTTWRVSWVGSGGAGGQLPDLQRTSSFPIAVAELQAVNY